MNYEIGQWVRYDNEDWFVVQDFGTAYILVRSSDDDIFETIVDQSEITGLSPLYEFQLGQTVEVKATKEQAKIVNIAEFVIDPIKFKLVTSRNRFHHFTFDHILLKGDKLCITK